MASLYKEQSWSSKLEPVTKKIVERLGGSGVFVQNHVKWWHYKLNYDNFNLVHSWSAHMVPTFVKEVSQSLTQQTIFSCCS